MTAETKKSSAGTQFGLTLVQKILYGVLLVAAAVLVVPLSPLFTGTFGTVMFVLYGILIGILSWYVSSGWAFGVEVSAAEIRVRDAGRVVAIPMDKVGMLVRGGSNPLFPAVWVVLRGAGVGRELPEKGVPPHAQELLAQFQRRNPGKKLTYVPIPMLYLRSVGEFVGELKRRIPPLTVDERLGRK
ncbi:hypothetical protein J2Z79_001052 [Symbiobacterium terraclitae]|uniref:Uncharacterized protein n=1 Tax=Symbiobacterium terraclitae TaxID=557451 RepID=A0ABS4JQ44_9FIRM|nr:hypothetical protein [Symbiobacterium terraclitae]MBP2017667.1 hypothetical protein [Symbiobacterium terraclitae]